MFALDVGSIRANVANLPEGETLVVRTPDAELEARGTAFRVATGEAVRCGAHSTQVAVESGTVVVRSGGKEERVAAGARWPASCDKAAVAEGVPAAPKAPARAGRGKHPSTPAETSELKAQTLLYGDAIGAKRSGDTRGAIARFDQYLALYPESALAEAASVNRMELLEAIDHARAASAARAYLQRYPSGHARDEAARIADGP
jgi:TolA-binding protein